MVGTALVQNKQLHFEGDLDRFFEHISDLFLVPRWWQPDALIGLMCALASRLSRVDWLDVCVGFTSESL